MSDQAKTAGVKRRLSRFEDDPSSTSNVDPPQSSTSSAINPAEIALAAAKAKALAQQIAAQGVAASAAPFTLPGIQVPTIPGTQFSLPTSASLGGGALAPGVLAALQSQIQAHAAEAKNKNQYRKLLLDAQGRLIDEQGNLVKQEILPVRTLAANVAAVNANKKKENPYLAHRQSTSANATGSATAAIPSSLPGVVVSGTATPFLPGMPALPGTIVSAPPEATSASAPSTDDVTGGEVVDERIPTKRRDLRGKRSLHFVDPGKYIREQQIIQEKEERKLISGYASGRKAIGKQQQLEEDGEEGEKTEVNPLLQLTSELLPKPSLVPPVLDTVLPSMEWWDEVFLPKQKRDQRKISKAAADIDEYNLTNINYCKTHIYVQHPIPVKPLGMNENASSTTIVPVYLTKKERKKLRKATRAEREREKRDKMMIGLIPTPEPKFKLSNFMKILGDQAVADPSKVELRVMQQMQQRVLNHQMRNLANKLTPKQRREKKIKKLKEDVSRGVTVAVFRVTDFSCLKYRFKVDINAQQYFLSGLVLLCPNEDGKNLVVVEGGPRGIRKFIHLMSRRIRWEIDVPPLQDLEVVQDGEEWNYSSAMGNKEEGVEVEDEDDKEDEDSEGEDDSDDEDEEDAGSAEGTTNQQRGNASHNGSQHNQHDGGIRICPDRRCDLLWQGILPKRMFTGFKFQEAKSSSVAKKMLEGKNATHYWDMVENADNIIASNTVDEW